MKHSNYLHTCDFLVVGAGIVGLAIARELNLRHPKAKIIILEKEPHLAEHGSGRNSGVLHAGFYYTADSLKARFTVEGNRMLTEYCQSRGLPLNPCGKVVVARSESEVAGIHELKKRGDKNGSELFLIDEKELSELEPNAKTCKLALWSPKTSTINPVLLMKKISDELVATGQVSLLFSHQFEMKAYDSTVITRKGRIKYKHLVNAAGLYSDRVAQNFGVGEDYVVLPFKGLYMEYKFDGLLKRHVYPVPNLNNPFLGVHFTITVDGHVKAGPTATPALWREHYVGLDRFKLGEFAETLKEEAKLFFLNSFGFRSIAFTEIKKYMRSNFIAQASSLLKNCNTSLFGDYIKPGIRAQLLNKKTRTLVQDFMVEKGENSTHVLNAVSPGLTCSMPFAKHVVDVMEGK